MKREQRRLVSYRLKEVTHIEKGNNVANLCESVWHSPISGRKKVPTKEDEKDWDKVGD